MKVFNCLYTYSVSTVAGHNLTCMDSVEMQFISNRISLGLPEDFGSIAKKGVGVDC